MSSSMVDTASNTAKEKGSFKRKTAEKKEKILGKSQCYWVAHSLYVLCLASKTYAEL